MSTATVVIEVNDETKEVGVGVFGEGLAKAIATRMMDVATVHFAEDGRVRREDVVPS